MRMNDICIVPIGAIVRRTEGVIALVGKHEVCLTNAANPEAAECLDNPQVSTLRIQISRIDNGSISGRILAVKDTEGGLRNIDAEDYNENCLENMRCARCGSLGNFEIAIRKKVVVTDEGIEESYGLNEWDELSYCKCLECSETGVVADFRETQKHSEEW